ncbi:MAG: hypothetical protein GWM98_29435 [Nitrospinaceae bacterium]|nr:hypothetical protein [Nitrospinaceae bacterium]NIR57828.1 hypothetical protein [Nitrospinaceae bacterium]NIS88291.1 hypothetical protein [Nitrospinaceae bacterium]NIT85168.1 hypothetical protein [Nitrospinaceae bacterium]NIU47322.1 hypothetical protein [Nitrospinaceae bacterium]
MSPKLKYFVIGLTFFTIMAFGLFAALVVKRFFISPAEQVTWGPQLVTIAEELKNSGLKVQAIEQYQKYLDTQEVSLTTRSHISNEILKLHVELGQCDEAAVWHLHSKTAQPTALWVKESETLLQQCQKQKKP